MVSEGPKSSGNRIQDEMLSRAVCVIINFIATDRDMNLLHKNNRKVLRKLIKNKVLKK